MPDPWSTDGRSHWSTNYRQQFLVHFDRPLEGCLPLSVDRWSTRKTHDISFFPRPTARKDMPPAARTRARGRAPARACARTRVRTPNAASRTNVVWFVSSTIGARVWLIFLCCLPSYTFCVAMSLKLLRVLVHALLLGEIKYLCVCVRLCFFAVFYSIL